MTLRREFKDATERLARLASLAERRGERVEPDSNGRRKLEGERLLLLLVERNILNGMKFDYIEFILYLLVQKQSRQMSR